MKHLLFKLQSFLALLMFTAVSAYAQKSPVDMNRFIDDLMKKMTLEEKIGRISSAVLLRSSSVWQFANISSRFSVFMINASLNPVLIP